MNEHQPEARAPDFPGPGWLPVEIAPDLLPDDAPRHGGANIRELLASMDLPAGLTADDILDLIRAAHECPYPIARCRLTREGFALQAVGGRDWINVRSKSGRLTH